MSKEHTRIAYEKGYRATKLGNVIGPKGEPRKLMIHKGGSKKLQQYKDKHYHYITVRIYGGRSGTKKVLVCWLQAYQKFGEKWLQRGIVTRHLNDCSLDDSWDNIGIGTQTMNMRDRPHKERLAHARLAGGVRRKLSNAQLDEFRKLRGEGTSLKDLAARFGIAKSTASYIANGKTYNYDRQEN